MHCRKMKYFFLIFILFIYSVCLHGQTWDELYHKARELYYNNNNIEALPLAKQSIEAAQKEFGDSDINFVRSNQLTAYIYIDMNARLKAEPLLIKVVNILSKEENEEYAIAVYDLGTLYLDMKKYSDAEPLLIKAKDMRKNVSGEKDVNYIKSLLAIGKLYRQMERFTEAVPLVQEALRNSYFSLGEHNNITLSSTLLLAFLFYDIGQYEKAEPLFTGLTQFYEDNKKENFSNYFSSLLGLAKVYSAIGLTDKAEYFFIRSIECSRKNYGEKSSEYVNCLDLLASLYIQIGDYTKAEPLLNQSLELNKNIRGENSKEYIRSLDNLASWFLQQGKYAASIEQLLKVGNLIKNNIGENTVSYASTLSKMAGVYQQMKQFTNAEQFYLQSGKIFKDKLGENHSQYFSNLVNLGKLYIEMGETDKAENFLKQGAVLQEKNLGENHPQYINTQTLVAELYEKSGNYKKAVPIIVSKNRLIVYNLFNAFTSLSETEKRNYLNKNSTTVLENSNSFLYNHPNATEELCESNFGLLQILKSLSMATTRNMIESVRKSTDNEVIKKLNEWDSLKILLAKEYSLKVVSRRKDLNEIEQKAEMLEKNLSVNSTGFKNFMETLNGYSGEMQYKMDENEAAVEFVRFRLYNKQWTDSIMYAAFVLCKNDTLPHFIPLCEEKQLGKYFSPANGAETIKTIYRSDPVDESDKPAISGDSLYALVRKPLMPYLMGIKKISYSPAGLLNRIAFQALPISDSLLLMDKYELNQYLTTRLRMIDETNEITSKSITLFGDCQFTIDSTTIVNSIPANEKANTLISVKPLRSENAGGWKQLASTADEIKSIQNLFVQNKISTTSFSQSNATEEQFKSLSGNSPSIIHLATHGFFLPDPEKKKQEGFAADERNAFTLADDPLLRSGIVLSGANRVWSGKPPIEGREDGIVTAYEIAQMDLSKTELVVLSACETALGDIKGSEGVFGLQRAFKLAGVKNMLLSLWKVPDAETAELMKDFYTYYLQGKTARESFASAQKDMRKKYKPYYWAAFVLIE